MSQLNKFIVYECDTCKRQIELQLNARCPDPIHCNITFKCSGRLRKKGERATKQYLFTPIAEGLQDYIQRGTKVFSAASVPIDVQVPLSTCAGNGALTLSIIKKDGLGFYANKSNGDRISLGSLSTAYPTITAKANFYEIARELLSFKQYAFSFTGSVSQLVGFDNNNSVLRFTSANRIKVFLNGIEVEVTAYNRTVENQITFTPTIFESSITVDVIVYNDISSSVSADEITELTFSMLNPATSSGLLAINSWGDYRSTQIGGVERYHLFCNDLSKLIVDKSYGFLGITINGHEIAPADYLFLLGREPFLAPDKELLSYVLGSKLIDDTVLEYTEDSSIRNLTLKVSESQIEDLVVPIVLLNNIKLSSDTSPGVQNLSNETIKHKYVLGPV